MRREFSKLYSAIDGYAKKVDAYAQEIIMLAHKVDPVRNLLCGMYTYY